MADGFLGRWSRRKQDAREGKAPEPEPPRPVTTEPAAVPADGAPVAAAPPLPAAPAQPVEPPPTLEDVKSLTPESDFTRFTRAGVAPDVKNAALKKLFADPHFNVQDGLDVYIGDYNTPDPLPEAMLRKLASAQFLNLFREEEEKDGPGGEARDDAEAEPAPSVAQCDSTPVPDAPGAPPAVPPDHADPDLRLQQDDAAEGGEPGRGTG